MLKCLAIFALYRYMNGVTAMRFVKKVSRGVTRRNSRGLSSNDFDTFTAHTFTPSLVVHNSSGCSHHIAATIFESYAFQFVLKISLHI